MNISIIGTGYVGLVTGTCFAEMGNQVICIDNDMKKLKKLLNKQIPIYEPGLDIMFQRNTEKGRLMFSSDLKEAVLKTDIIFLCLPTPQDEDGSADLQYVLEVADNIGKIIKENNIKDYKLVVNKSTVPVGTAEKVREKINNHGVENFDVVSNPEFLREGFSVNDFLRPDRIVIGSDKEKPALILKELYEPFVKQGNPIIFMDIPSAEMTKYASNSYLAMRITFMNELANLCEKTGADIESVRKGMGTDSRIGKRYLFAGIGYGGSCFPKDVKALINTSIEKSSEMTLLKTVDKINNAQKKVLLSKILSHFKNNIKGKHFAVWGLAFKPHTDDMREAPSIVIINGLIERGASVSAYDPAAMETAKLIIKDRVRYAENEYDVLNDADALLIITEWGEFRNPDYEVLKSKLKNRLIFDGRNILSIEKVKENKFTYYSIGRKTIKN